MKAQHYFLLMVLSAFVSVITFFKVDSYWADTHDFNGSLIAIGVVFGLVAGFFLYKVIKNSNTGGE
jgi:hypothetical protein